VWGDAAGCDGLAYAPGDPLGLSWLPLARAGRGGDPAVPADGHHSGAKPRGGLRLPAGAGGRGRGDPGGFGDEGRARAVGRADVHHRAPLQGVPGRGGHLGRDDAELHTVHAVSAPACGRLVRVRAGPHGHHHRCAARGDRGDGQAAVCRADNGDRARAAFILRSEALAKTPDRTGYGPRCPPEEQMLAQSLQGIVNRKQPRVFLLGDFLDTKWLDVLCKREGCKSTDCASLDELVAAFRGEISGAILYDPAEPHSVNGRRWWRLAECGDGDAGAGDAAGAAVVEDVRGRFTSDVAGVTRGRWRTCGRSSTTRRWRAWSRLGWRRETTWWSTRLFNVLAGLPVQPATWGGAGAAPSTHTGDGARPRGGVRVVAAGGRRGHWRGARRNPKLAIGQITVCTVGAYNLSGARGRAAAGAAEAEADQASASRPQGLTSASSCRMATTSA